MNLRRAPDREEKDAPCSFHMQACVCVHVRTRVDYPASLSSRVRAVTQPPTRNPRLGRLVCARDL